MTGILLIDKPEGMTSFVAAARVRRMTGVKKTGHTGTLDPMATGVLPVLLGGATRFCELLPSHDKAYTATLRLGTITDTLDITGEVLETREVNVSRAKLERALEGFSGEIEQVPPMYSALKVNGKKLYELAREGIEIERKARTVHFYEISILEVKLPLVRMEVTCSKGTYIRTLCHDLGQALGCGGCMAALRRTEASNFRIDEAVTLEDVAREGEALLRPTDSLFRQYPAYTIPSAEQERKCLCGNPLRAKLPDGLYRVYGRDGAFLALSEAKDGTLTSKRNFFSV